MARPSAGHTFRARGLKEIRGNFDGPIGVGVPDEVRDPNVSSRWFVASRRCCPRPTRSAFCMATRTSAISSWMRPPGTRACSIGSWCSEARGSSTSGTTSAAPWAWRIAGRTSVTSSRTTSRDSRSRAGSRRRGTTPGAHRHRDGLRVLPLGDHPQGPPAGHHGHARATGLRGSGPRRLRVRRRPHMTAPRPDQRRSLVGGCNSVASLRFP